MVSLPLTANYPASHPKAPAMAGAFGRIRGGGGGHVPPTAGLLSSDASVPPRQEEAAPLKPEPRVPADDHCCGSQGQ
jgi:hypothetical protein